MEELIDVLDEHGYKKGIVKRKSEIKKDGDYHRAISVCIINSDDEILLQKRSTKKRVYSGLWSMFLKGHIKAGETSEEALLREIKEELGLDVSLNEVSFLYTIYDEKVSKSYKERIFYDTYLLVKDIDIKDIKTNDEVEKVQFIKQSDLFNLIINNDNRIVPNYEDYKIVFSKLNYPNRLVKRKNYIYF